MRWRAVDPFIRSTASNGRRHENKRNWRWFGNGDVGEDGRRTAALLTLREEDFGAVDIRHDTLRERISFKNTAGSKGE